MEIRKKPEPKKNTAFAEWLQETIDERIKNGEYKSQRELAEAGNLLPSTLSSYKNGTFFPGEEKLQKLAKVLGVDPKDIEKFRYQVDENRINEQEYILTESELEELVKKRFGGNLDVVAEEVAAHLQPLYEDIGRRLQEIQDESKELRRMYHSLFEAHTKLLERYLSNS